MFIYIFLFEYYFLFLNITKIFFSKAKYFSIEINKNENFFWNSNILELWIKINYVEAFIKIYTLLSKKKKNIKYFFKILILFIFGIPFKIIKTIYEILSQDGKIVEKFEKYYASKLLISNNMKIEVLNKKIYLNGFTLGKLVNTVHKGNTNSLKDVNKDKNLIFNIYLNLINDLKSVNKDIIKKNLEFNKNIFIEKIITKNKEEEIIIKNYYGVVDIYKNNLFKSLHSTSNIPKNLNEYQKTYSPIPSMVIKNSKNPGTIETKYVKKVLYSGNKKIIKMNELSNIVSQLEKEDDNYYNISKDYLVNSNNIILIYKNILISYNFDTNNEIILSLINDLSSGNYNLTLENSNKSDIKFEISKIIF